jgi:hypothetical protein
MRLRSCLLVLVVLAVAVAAVAQQSPGNPRKTNEVAATLSSFQGAIDPQTGRLRELTAEERKALAQALGAMLNRTGQGMKVMTHSDGSEDVELGEGYEYVVIARVNENGGVEHVCVDDATTALSFMTYEDVKRAPASAPARSTAREKE